MRRGQEEKDEGVLAHDVPKDFLVLQCQLAVGAGTAEAHINNFGEKRLELSGGRTSVNLERATTRFPRNCLSELWPSSMSFMFWGEQKSGVREGGSQITLQRAQCQSTRTSSIH